MAVKQIYCSNLNQPRTEREKMKCEVKYDVKKVPAKKKMSSKFHRIYFWLKFITALNKLK